MRKNISFTGFAVLFISCIICLFPIHTYAEETANKENQDYVYRYNEEYKGIEIVSYKGKGLYIEVPDTIDNIPVTVIGESAFEYASDTDPVGVTQKNRDIREIVLPESILVIRQRAFSECYNLQEINLPKKLQILEENAFFGCRELESIELPDGLAEIAREAFCGCNSLGDIKIPKNIVRINERAFVGLAGSRIVFEKGSKLEYIGRGAFIVCTNLKEINFPDSLKEIDNEAFSYCSELKKVKFGKKSELKRLGAKAFAHCRRLSEITFPKKVSELDNKAFAYCRKLKKVIFKGKAPVIKSNVFQKIYSETEFKVPKKYRTAYLKKLKKEQGFKKTMKIV